MLDYGMPPGSLFLSTCGHLYMKSAIHFEMCAYLPHVWKLLLFFLRRLAVRIVNVLRAG